MDFLQPLIIGLFGSFHCIGMCGPISVALPLKEHSWTTRITSTILYNLGRMITYIFLGLVFGLAGLGFYLWGFQQWVSIGMGALMIFSVGFPLLFRGKKIAAGTDRLFSGLKKTLGRYLGFRTYFSVWIIGLLNGLLPCGLVYLALAGALVATSPLQGAYWMLFFGLGTVPAMMFLSLAGNFITVAFRRRIQKLIPYFILLIGILFVLRGMNLGIPYLSPKMEPYHPKTEEFQKPKCCE